MARTIKTTLELGGESAYKKGLQSIDHALMEQDWLQVGIDIIKGLANGLIDGVNNMGQNQRNGEQFVK